MIFNDSVTLKEGFEGPEKRLEVEFEPDFSPRCFSTPINTPPTAFNTTRNANTNSANISRSMRSFTREQWQSLLTLTGCTILNVIHNECWDAYLLSESSLFVAPTRVVIKTCGRTMLLCGIDRLVEYAKSVGLKVRRVIYFRKNFTFPGSQKFPHRDFNEEVTYLNERFIGGRSYVLGPQCTDHWLVYVASPSTSTSASDQYMLLELKMHDLDARVMNKFFYPSDVPEGVDANADHTGDRVTVDSGIQAILPEMRIDPYLFQPCGYSMNGLQDSVYSTIHITPESHCSYVSYEVFFSGQDLHRASSPRFLSSLIRKVLDTFRPASFTCAAISSSKVGLHSILRAALPATPYLQCTPPTSASDFEFERIYSCSAKVDKTLTVSTEMVALLPNKDLNLPARSCSPSSELEEIHQNNKATSEVCFPPEVATSLRRLFVVSQAAITTSSSTAMSSATPTTSGSPCQLPASCVVVQPFISSSFSLAPNMLLRERSPSPPVDAPPTYVGDDINSGSNSKKNPYANVLHMPAAVSVN